MNVLLVFPTEILLLFMDQDLVFHWICFDFIGWMIGF